MSWSRTLPAKCPIGRSWGAWRACAPRWDGRRVRATERSPRSTARQARDAGRGIYTKSLRILLWESRPENRTERRAGGSILRAIWMGRRGLEARTSAVASAGRGAYYLRELGVDERCSRCYVVSNQHLTPFWVTAGAAGLLPSTIRTGGNMCKEYPVRGTSVQPRAL